MSIFNKKHIRFRNAVINSMNEVATIANTVYSNDDKKLELYVDYSVDAAFHAIVYSFDKEVYESLCDTVCRNIAKSEILNSVKNNNIDDIDFDSVFEDVENMMIE